MMRPGVIFDFRLWALLTPIQDSMEFFNKTSADLCYPC